MDPKLLAQNLAEAERHVLSGQYLVERQIELIEELARNGRDTVRAAELLSELQGALASRTQQRDRLRTLLSELEQLRVVPKGA